MSGRPWYSFYPDAYERDAGHLSYVQDSAYRRMLDHYYKTGEPLPLDKDAIYRACRAMRREERQAIDFCLLTFFVQGDDGYHQPRADAEIIKAAEVSAKRAAAANKRHCKNDANASGIAVQLDTQSTVTTTELSLRDSIGASQAKPPRERKAKRALPESFPAEPEFEYARQRWLAKGRADLCEGISDQAQKFRDHHTANATRSADWSASWRTWVGNAMDFTRAPPPPTGGGGKEPWTPVSLEGL